MSHFSRIKTQIVEKEILVKALEDLGYEVEEGDLHLRGFIGEQASVELLVKGKHFSNDIGFHRSGNTYEIIADWWGVRGTNQKEFTNKVSQRYAYQASRKKFESQGFTVVDEVNEKGQIRLLLRRMV